MSNSGITVDWRSFNQAFAEYTAASKKDWADAMNHKLKDVAFRAQKHVPTADRMAIRKLKTEYKLIAYILKKTKGTPGTNGRYYTRREARRFANRLVAKRGRAVGFMKAWFIRAARGMAQYIRGDGIPTPMTTGKFKDLGLSITPARPGRVVVADFSVRYNYKKRGAKTANRTEAILYRALQRGVYESAKDMGVYVQRKVDETARRHSA